MKSKIKKFYVIKIIINLNRRVYYHSEHCSFGIMPNACKLHDVLGRGQFFFPFGRNRAMNIFTLTLESLKMAHPRILVLYIYVHIHELVLVGY